MVYVLVAVICALALFWLAVPLLDNQAARRRGPVPQVQADDTRRTELLDRRETLLRSLRELEFDRSMGKLEDTEYETQRADLAAQTARVLDSLETKATPAHAPAFPGSNAPASLDAVLELEVAVQRYRNRPEIFSQ